MPPERCDCKTNLTCLAESGELPVQQRCVEGRVNYCPSLDHEIRPNPLHYMQEGIEIDCKGG